MIKRLLPYKDLLIIYIWREFNVRYRHSVIGILWAVLQPLSLMLLFVFIFTFVVHMKVGNYPKAIFYYSGLLPWTFFASSMNYSIPSLATNYDLITKIYFPREILPISGIAIAFIDYIIASVVYLGLMIFYGIAITWAILWLIPLFILLLIFTIALSLFFSCINVYYRDVRLATNLIIRILFFASPVLYSIDSLNIKLKILMFLNPLTFIIENMRRCVLEGRGVVIWQFVFVSSIIFIFYYFSYKYFIKTEKNFADVI